MTANVTLPQWTPLEYRILSELRDANGHTLTALTLLRRVWGGYTDGTTLRVHVARMRKKMPAVLRLETVRGYGYKLTGDMTVIDKERERA